MWIHLNLIGIGLLTILVPCIFYDNPNSTIIMSTFLFFSGIYLTALYFVLLYYKETKETLAKDYKKLKEEMDDLINEKNLLESKLAENMIPNGSPGKKT